MGFPTVKSDPWKKRAKRRVRRLALWPDAFWKRLSDRARDDWTVMAGHCGCGWISPACLEMIREINSLLSDPVE